MPRNGSGVYSLPAGSTATTGQTIEAATHNTPLADLVTDANTARPVVAGGTGATTASGARTNLSAQQQGDVLDDLNTLGANSADGEFLVGTGAGALAWESGATARTSLGLGSAALLAVAEGTWTVQISDDSENSSSTTATGRYYAIGDLVFAFIPTMSNINTAGLTAGDGIRISLPFTAKANFGGGGEIVSSSWASFAGGGDGNLKISAAVGAAFARIVNDGGIAQPAANLIVSNINSGTTDINSASVVFIKA